jgi:hypothetical protein
MWLQTVCVPDALDTGRTDSLLSGHGSYTPMGCCFGFAVQSSLHDLLHLGGSNGLFTTTTRGVCGQRRWAALLEPAPPQDYSSATDLQFLGDGTVGFTGSSQKHDARSQDNLLRSIAGCHPGL